MGFEQNMEVFAE